MEIRVVRDVLDVNKAVAAEMRREYQKAGVFVLNLMSSPGSGKTTLLERTIARLAPRLPMAVIVGDICTTRDADRLSRKGEIPVIQICTEPFGGDCHLAAHVVREAAAGLDLAALDLLVVENVGNLVCPAEFDIGEDRRAVVLSVAEGEDKPLKYPLMFQVCDLALLNKIDLLPHLDYDLGAARKNIEAVHPGMTVFEVSARTGSGMEAWFDWITEQVKQKRGARSKEQGARS
jgi:hydrogenase nickel incorporation protein HypB